MLSPTIGHPLAAQWTRSWWVRPVSGVRASQVNLVFPSVRGGGVSAFDHPPLEGEGRTAKGSPGWGDGGAADDGDASYPEALSPPPGPLARADPGSIPGQALPPPGAGEDRPSTRH